MNYDEYIDGLMKRAREFGLERQTACQVALESVCSGRRTKAIHYSKLGLAFLIGVFTVVAVEIERGIFRS